MTQDFDNFVGTRAVSKQHQIDTAALSATYALLPCVIKLAALAWFWAQRPRLQPGVCPC